MTDPDPNRFSPGTLPIVVFACVNFDVECRLMSRIAVFDPDLGEGVRVMAREVKVTDVYL